MLLNKYFKSKSIYTLWMLVFILLLTACSQTEKQEVKSAVMNAVDSEAVRTIKEMTMEDTNIKLGDLFESGIGSPTYELYDPAENGKRYVTIKGNINYAGKDVVAVVQYEDVGDDKYKFNVLEYNGVPQTEFQAGLFFQYLIDEYDKKTAEKNNSNKKAEAVSNTKAPDTSKADKGADIINYTNSRFGYSIDYPKNWGEAVESEKGDGCRLFEDEATTVSVYAGYNMEDDFESYLKNNYDGWEFSDTEVKGASQAVKAEYGGEESYQIAIIAEKEGTIYTFLYIDMYINPDYSDELRESTQKAVGMMKKTFKVF